MPKCNTFATIVKKQGNLIDNIRGVGLRIETQLCGPRGYGNLKSGLHNMIMMWKGGRLIKHLIRVAKNNDPYNDHHDNVNQCNK